MLAIGDRVYVVIGRSRYTATIRQVTVLSVGSPVGGSYFVGYCEEGGAAGVARSTEVFFNFSAATAYKNLVCSGVLPAVQSAVSPPSNPQATNAGH